MPKMATFRPPGAEKLIFSDKTLPCSIDCAPKHIDINIDIDMVIFENIDIDKTILKNIDIDMTILKNINTDKAFLKNINIDID